MEVEVFSYQNQTSMLNMYLNQIKTKVDVFLISYIFNR